MATATRCHFCGAFSSSSLVCPSCGLIHYCTDSHLSLDSPRHSESCRKYTTYLETLKDLEHVYSNPLYSDNRLSSVFPTVPNREYLRGNFTAFNGAYCLYDSECFPVYFSATLSVLSSLLEIDTRQALDKVLVIATDLAYLFFNQYLAAPYFLAVLLKLGRDELCFKYIRCYSENELRQDYEGNQPLMKVDGCCCYQLSADRIWTILTGFEFEGKLEGHGIILGDIQGNYPVLRHMRVEFNVAYVLLYLKLKADLVSLRAFDSVEGFFEERLNYDVKEVIKGFIPDTETIKEAMRKGDWKSVASGRYEEAIAKVEEKARYYFFAADKKDKKHVEEG